MKRTIRIGSILLLAAVPTFALAVDRDYIPAIVLVQMGDATAYVHSTEGGEALADVVPEKMGADRIVHQHITAPHYEPFVFEIPFNGFNAAIRSFLGGTGTRLSGTVTELNFDGEPLRAQSFQNAVITELGFPELDAASKNAGSLRIKVQPESVRNVAGSKIGPRERTAVNWRPRDFRVEIAGLDCSKVSKVEAFTIKQSGSALEFPRLRLSVSTTTATAFAAWHEDFVIRGNNDQAHEKTGTITLLSSEGDPLIVLDLAGIGIYGIRRTNDVRRSEVLLYVESMMLRRPVQQGVLPILPGQYPVLGR